MRFSHPTFTRCALAAALGAVLALAAHAGDLTTPAVSAIPASTPLTTPITNSHTSGYEGPSGPTSTAAAEPTSTRYGLFDLLDHRSSYGQGVFPEPFLIDDSDLEVNEFRLDWYHAKAGSSSTNIGTMEVEKGFGQLTLEVEVPYERDASPGNVTQGMDNVDLGARLPVYQYVAPNNSWDTTFGVGVEVGIPTTSQVSKNTEFVPKVFNDLRIGDHFTLQSIVGLSTLYGPGDDGGLQVFEYGALAGITIHHNELPIPGVDQIIPLFEVSGEKQLNHEDKGTNSLIGNVAVRFNLKAIGPIQPRLGVGWIFALNQAARDDIHNGVYVSFVFEY